MTRSMRIRFRVSSKRRITMNVIRKALTALGAIFLLALLLAALAPKAARGFAAAMVEVANTSVNPVPNRDVDNSARDTFQASFDASCTGSGILLSSCSGLLVPSSNGSGQPVSMLVIEFVSGNCPGTNPLVLFNYSVGDFNSHVGFFTGFTASSTSGQFLQSFVQSSNGFAQQTRLYAAAGTTVAALTTASCNLNVSGYLVTP
jgi:hypothetical protein